MIAETAATRTRVCLECRTALPEHEPCDGGRNHRVASLHGAEGREALVREVWGTPSVRRRARELAKAGGVGVASGGALDLCSGIDCLSGSDGLAGLAGVVVVLVLTGLVMLLYLAVVKTIEWRRRKRHELRPHGALLRPRVRGQLLRGSVEALPGGPPEVGFALELRHRGALREGLMLREGASRGFEVALEEGGRAHVPAGRLRLEGPAGREQGIDRAELERYLGSLDPQHAAARDAQEAYEDPLPFTRAVRLELRAGDRVELQGSFERRVLPGANVGYREAAPSLLVASGVVLVRLLP